jgi:hypothetical protein
MMASERQRVIGFAHAIVVGRSVNRGGRQDFMQENSCKSSIGCLLIVA